MELLKITEYLDELLDVRSFRDASSNGLQVEGRRNVDRVAFAVDACLETFHTAKELDADMIVVHHGLVWGGVRYIRGVFSKRVGFLLENDLSLYVAHLPLDAHPEIGNNIQILKMLGGEREDFFAEYEGRKIGVWGKIEPIRLKELKAKIEDLLETKTFSLDFGKDEVERISVLSGSGSFAVEEADQISDCLITGEFRHEAYHIAKELQFNIIFAGHYATETLGLKALMEKVEALGVECEFIENPVPP